MNKSISTATCIGETAIKTRLTLYKSANAAGKAMNMDPKTIRQIESGVPVRLTNIQSYAEHLGIPIDNILLEEDLASVKESRAVLDYTNENLFHDSPLFISGRNDRPIIVASALGQPCDSTKFVSLLTKMKSERGKWDVHGAPKEEPIWKIHESSPISEGLPQILEDLQTMISSNVMTRQSGLADIIGQLKARESFNLLLGRLDEEFSLHILGCLVSTCILFVDGDERQTDDDVELPLFVIASNKVREFNLTYRKMISLEEDNNLKAIEARQFLMAEEDITFDPENDIPF